MSRASFERVLAPLLRSGVVLEPVPGARDVPEARLFWARRGSLVLQVAVVYHRFLVETFTFDLYLGRTFTFALAAPGYPRPFTRRFDELLDQTASVGGFFTGSSAEVATLAAEELQRAVDPFLAQPGFADAVLNVPLSRRIETSPWR
jgi:hypothetical protein